MQQTILSLLALMIIGLFLLNQYGETSRAYNKLVDEELEIAAGSVASQVIELIGNHAFDARTLPAEINTKGMLAGSGELTSAASFGMSTGCDLDAPYKDVTPCLDIDDVHMSPGEWQDVPFTLKDGKILPFDVHVDVFYVASNDLDRPLTTGTSLFKKVVVRVRSKRHVALKRYMNGFVRLERIFSYDSKRTLKRFHETYGATAIPAKATATPTVTTSVL